MLKHVPALLTPDALHALASMGHGDELAIVDAHFPAARVAAQHGARLVHLPGADLPAVARAVLQLMPLDTQGGASVHTMQVIGEPRTVPPAVSELGALLREAGEDAPGALERFVFYERAARAFAVFACGEQRTYGNALLRKGVLQEPPA